MTFTIGFVAGVIVTLAVVIGIIIWTLPKWGPKL